MKTIVIDVDDTICKTYNRDYDNSEKIEPICSIINKLYDSGDFKIVLYTARGQLSCEGDIEMIENLVKPKLVRWLANNNVKYHELHMGKPYSDTWYVDDKAIHPERFVEMMREYE